MGFQIGTHDGRSGALGSSSVIVLGARVPNFVPFVSRLLPGERPEVFLRSPSLKGRASFDFLVNFRTQ